MDERPPPGAPAARPADWVGTDLAAALYAVMLALPELRHAIAHRLALNPSEVDAMEHLMRRPIGPVDLSRLLGMSSASATVLVDRLEQAGHAVREPDPTDGRRRVVRPTATGAEAVFRQIGPLVSDLVGAENELSAKDKRVVQAYLERVLAVLRAHS